jgi:hypothetical protein
MRDLPSSSFFYLHIPLLCFRNVSFSTFCSLLFLRKIPRHMPCLSIGITIHLSSSASSSSSSLRKKVPSTIVSPSVTSSYFCMALILSSFSFWFLELFSGNSSAPIWIFPSVSLAFLPGQIFLYFQCHMIRFLYTYCYHHTNFILNLIPQAIYIPGFFFFIILSIPFSDVEPIKLFSVLFH